jgi:GPH family glycoside/pentoside/hexuronide:cation symporter
MDNVQVVKDAPPFGLKDKIGYALGDFGSNLSFVLVSTFFMVYYVTVIGINPVHFGLLILITKIWDGINDPMIGSLVDKLKPGKYGKFKPWMFYGSFALVLAGVVMFVPVHSAPYWAKLLVCVISYVIWDMCYTIVNVPYGAMSSVMTTNAIERAELSKYRALGALLGNVPAGVILPLILYNQSTGDPIGSRFFGIAIVMGVLAWICFQLSIKMCTERIVHNVEAAPKDAPKEISKNSNKVSYFRTFSNSMRSRPMLGLIIGTSALLMFLQSNNATNQYVFMLYYKRPDMLSLTMLMNYTAQLITMIAIRPLLNKIDKKDLVTYPMIGIIAITLFLMLSDVANPYIWVIGQFLIGLLQGPLVMLMWSLIGDCIDYMEYTTGERTEGSVYSTVTLFRKISSGFGSSVIGLGLASIGYNQLLTVAEQDPGIGENMKNFAALFVMIGAIIIFISMRFIYNLNNEKMEEITLQLGRDTSGAPATSDSVAAFD